ncbi:agmatinase [bacterium]|nr:agmatinase [bacterium]
MDQYNFLGIPDVSLKKARFLILPIPFEATTSCLAGTKDGPSSIIASSNYVELYDEELKAEPYLVGVKTLPEVPPNYKSIKQMVADIKKASTKYLKENKRIIGLGGEHTVSLGLVESCLSTYPNLKVLSFDAHSDLRDQYQGTKFSHACVMRRISELGCKIWTAGVRSISKEEQDFINQTDTIKILFAYQMAEKWGEVLNKMLPAGNYYLSFDLDFLDPSILPETGTPEPGGFYWNQTIGFFRQFVLRKDINIVGFDVVELAPQKNVTPSSFLAAKLIYKLIGLLAVKDNLLSDTMDIG